MTKTTAERASLRDALNHFKAAKHDNMSISCDLVSDLLDDLEAAEARVKELEIDIKEQYASMKTLLRQYEDEAEPPDD